MSEDDDFDIPASDDELAALESWDAEHKNYVSWEPPPADIASLYEKLEKDGVIELQMKCLPRRAPTPKPEEPETKEDEKEEEEKPEETPSKKPAVPSFDFDEFTMETTPAKTFTPTRRTPGSRPTPRSGQRRVARMDNIMSSIMRHRRQEPDDTPVKPSTSKDSEKKTDNTEGKGSKKEEQKEDEGKEGEKDAPPVVSTENVKQEPVETPPTPQRPPSRTRSRRT
ncbi:Hypp465 [Branchiostoma lanceolatum]|uniref:Hypp465 protein n=1 Tax=Branchiostoma lanceolatum TaxID=7740 RepID=A0A8J9VV49_BRALA|nr:Hypp465 [Branchiostoma lanceolatum]